MSTIDGDTRVSTFAQKIAWVKEKWGGFGTKPQKT